MAYYPSQWVAVDQGTTAGCYRNITAWVWKTASTTNVVWQSAADTATAKWLAMAEQWAFAPGNYAPPPATPEQLAAWNAADKAREEERKKASERARGLLVSLLTDEQQKQLEREEKFELQVGDRLYRISPGKQVERLEPVTRKVLSKFCIHAVNHWQMPAEDMAISHKLLLEADETKFLEIANETKVA